MPTWLRWRSNTTARLSRPTVTTRGFPGYDGGTHSTDHAGRTARLTRPIGKTRPSFSLADFEAARIDNPMFSNLAAANGVTVMHDGMPVAGQIVTGNYFQLLGARPRLGRTILPDDVAMYRRVCSSLPGPTRLMCHTPPSSFVSTGTSSRSDSDHSCE
jgi:hypothetical protein